MVIFWLTLACTDPDFGHLGVALEAYDDGRSALSTGSPMVAAEAFGRAAAADPGSDTLVAWEARALRKASEEGLALNRLNAGLKRFPDSSLLRYDRAALRAKMGDISGAADDLRWLYATEEANPIAVGEDPDFVSLRTDPTARILVPSAQVEASVELGSATVLVGETYVLDFRITSRTGAGVSLRQVGDSPAPMHIQRIVEDVIDAGPIWTQRRLSVEVKATTVGRTAMGPWMVDSASTAVLTERVLVEAVALEGRRMHSKQAHSLPLVVPSTRWPDASPPGIEGEGDERWAILGSQHSVRPQESKTGLHMEYREGGQPRWTAWQLAAGVGVELWEGGEAVSRLD